MFKHVKPLALLLCLAFVGSVVMEDAYAQRRGSSRSSRPSTSRPSSGSKPKFGSSSSSSSKKPKFGSSSSSSKPKFGSSSKPSTSSSKPKFGSSSSSKKPSAGSSTSSSKPKFGSGSKPSTSQRPSSPGSSRPSTSSSAKTRAAQQATSKRKYEETKRATAPPKPSYTNSHGKTVNVRRDSATVKSIRSRPSSYYTPAAREQRVTVHVSNHYSHPYSYYHSQPYYYVGGGYSSAFWYMMMEWNAERRARWLYHNRSNIDSAAYQRGIQDAEVQARLAALEAQNTPRNTDYVDPEFADNPDMQYSQEYIEAAYNPTVVASSGNAGAAGTAFVWIIVIFVGVIAVWFVMTKLRWGN